jgi:pyruvate,orthophosphate dikinase
MTEHMFFEEERIEVIRPMILAETDKERERFLEILFKFRKSDICKILVLMDRLPLTIRLIDTPLHEFLT